MKNNQKYYMMKLFVSYNYITINGYEDTGDFSETIIFENDENEDFVKNIPFSFEELYEKKNEFDEKIHYYYLIEKIHPNVAWEIINFNQKIEKNGWKGWRNTFHFFDKKETKKIFEQSFDKKPREFVDNLMELLIKKEENKIREQNFKK